jgi:hypothetical protein
MKTVQAPVLVVHDPEDKEVPFAHGAAIAHAAPNGALMEKKGVGHQRILKDADVVRATVEFLKSPERHEQRRVS